MADKDGDFCSSSNESLLDSKVNWTKTQKTLESPESLLHTEFMWLEENISMYISWVPS